MFPYYLISHITFKTSSMQSYREEIAPKKKISTINLTDVH